MDKRQSLLKGRKRLMILIIVVIAVAVVCIMFYQMQKNILNSFTEAPPELYMLERTDLESKVTASGNFESLDPVTIGSNVVGGEVETVYVSQGDFVYAGDVLAVLKTTDLLREISDTQEIISESNKSDGLRLSQAQRAVNEARDQYNINYNQGNLDINKAAARVGTATQEATDAQAALDAAIAASAATDVIDKLNQALKLAQEGVVAAQDAYDEAVIRRDNQARSDSIRIQDAQDQVNSLSVQNNVRQSKSQLASLEEDLSNAQIVSSISGIVTEISTEAGKAAMGNMFVVENTELLQITATVAEYDVIKVVEGQKTHVTSNALGDQIFEGIVDFVSPVAADTQGNFEVRVKLTSPVGQLRPGMTATVEIVTESKEAVFSVPIDSVVTKPNGTKVVYVYEPNASIMPAQQTPPGDVEGDIVPGESIGSAVPMGPVEGDGPQVIVSDGSSGPGLSSGFSRREIVVTTGMETDYYIEISSDELTEGMLILADPEGRNVVSSNPAGYDTMMGNGMGAQTVTVVDSAGTDGVVYLE